MTYQDAITKVPAGAKVTSTFGNPGDGGYAEFHRAPDGRRWQITNGQWDATEPFDWAIREVPLWEDAPGGN